MIASIRVAIYELFSICRATGNRRGALVAQRDAGPAQAPVLQSQAAQVAQSAARACFGLTSPRRISALAAACPCFCRYNVSAVPQQIPDLIRARLCRLAARIPLGHYSDSITESIALACDLIVADVATPPVVAVASLAPDETWRDAGARILEMLESLGAAVPQVEDETTAWPIVLRAFGFCDLPLGDFYGPFLRRLPAWDEQDDFERSLNLLLDELDHAGNPQAREAVVALMRAAVRGALD
jgi:hypothetical protein